MSHPRLTPAARALGAALLISTLSLPARAQNPASIAVTVNGNPVDFGGAAPTQVGGRTLVPLRAIFEALGAQVEFASGTIRARRGDTNLQLALGSNQAIVNGAARTLEVPAQAVFGRTLVPLRFVGEAFGASVNFNSATQTISIVAPDAPLSGGGLPNNGGFPTSGFPNSGFPNPPVQTAPPFTVPNAGQSVSGTLVKIDTNPPATVTISLNGALRTYALNENALVLRQISLSSAASATPIRQAARQIALSSLAAGDPVRLNLDAANRVSQITTTPTVLLARVQFAGGGQIILDDDRDTTLTLGPNLRFIDASGRVSNDPSGLAEGQNVALFLSRENRAVYQVSAYAPDFTASSGAGSGVADPFNPATPLPTLGTGQIQLVAHNANTPLRAGTRLNVTARATPGMRLGFSLGSRIQNVALSEDPARAGVYLGSYLVKSGDDVLNARVAVRGTGANGQEDFAQSSETATIDTVAPRLVGTFPANGGQIGVAQPNIVIFADDLGGSGLGNARIDLVTGDAINPIVTRIPATVAPTSVSAVATAPLSGSVGVRAVIADKAGNTLPVNFSFSVVPGAGGGFDLGTGTAMTGAITSFSHGATRAIGAGDDVPLVLIAQPAGRASFDVLNAAGQTIARGVPLVEVRPGRYRATYRVPETAQGNLRFIGRFTGADGTSSQLEATARVPVVGGAAATATTLSIQTPREGDRVTSPLAVRGQAAPDSVVDVALSAEGTQLFILQYKQDLGVKQARADANGNWSVSLDLPSPRGVSNLRYIISATQTDAAGQTGVPVVVTVSR